jgi:DNA-binding transcriptional LysR family regulator
MNVHHLELFYYVARHGGIAAAVRKMPYGIQQPAVSGQIGKLEEDLGVKLLQRRPFILTPAGGELFEFIEPFFGRLELVEANLRRTSQPQLRIAAPAIVLRDHMPSILRRLRARAPQFRLHLREATATEAERMLEAQEIEFAILMLEKKRKPGARVRSLVKLPLVLLAPKGCGITSAEQLWKQDRIEQILITFAQDDPVRMHLDRELEQRGIEWRCGIEANSNGLIESYAAAGYGIGVAVAVPGHKPKAGLKVIPLLDLAPVEIGVAWGARVGQIGQVFLEELEKEAKAI